MAFINANERFTTIHKTLPLSFQTHIFFKTFLVNDLQNWNWDHILEIHKNKRYTFFLTNVYLGSLMNDSFWVPSLNSFFFVLTLQSCIGCGLILYFSSKIISNAYLYMFRSTLITDSILFAIQVKLIPFIMESLIQVYLSLRVLTMKVLL
jgi:hypothetical protein